ncbi:hypothetical protein ABZ714_20125 [Streptomyces sp. NPDC006798]|uniref:hypothetical protein n=1 Tax=Streptomyces sp. NPDC006798 TaxID=3155462 RepID=UPI0033C93EFE
MADNPQAPHGQGPEGAYDPAGSTQMFRAFVDDGAPEGRRRDAAPERSGSRIGLIAGVVVALAVLGGALWLALG